ncbi:MAG: adenylate cyclase, partial [Thermoanaerobaculia bacterium]
AQALAEQGAFAEGLAYAAEGMRIADELQHIFSLAVAYYYPGYLYSIKGDWAEAARLLERVATASDGAGMHLWSGITLPVLGYVGALRGQGPEKLEMIRRGLKVLEGTGALIYSSLFVGRFAEASLRCGRPEEAPALAGQALMLARERGERGYEAWALRAVADAFAHPDALDAESAEGHYRLALALAEELGMRPLRAHCHLGLGRLLGRTRRLADARAHLAAATTAYRELDMPFWLGEAEQGSQAGP